MSLKGRIVEYIENGKFICAYALEDNDTRLHMLNQNRREINLPLNRIVQFNREEISPNRSREEILAILDETAERRKKLTEGISLAEVWSLVSEKPEEIFTLDFMASLYFGNEPTDDQSAAFLRAVIANPLYFKFKSGKILALSPETVTQIKIRKDKEKEQENFISKNSRILQQIRQAGKIPVDWEDGEMTLQILRDYYLFGKEAPEHILANKLTKNAQLTSPHDIFQLLVRAGIWDKNENIPLLRYNIPDSFSENALTEAEKIAHSPAINLSEARRQDLRNLHLITIDGATTKDFDDALHLEKKGENYLVGIHISDVGCYAKPGTALFDEALTRGTSIYFPEKSISMLPKSLAENKLSLLKDQDRPTLSFLVLLSPSAEILRFSVVHSITSVKQQLTFTEADRLSKHDETLAAMVTLSKLLRQRRVNNGALLLPMPELHISIEPNDTIRISSCGVDTPSRVLVAEFMILANTLGAQFVAEREAPGLFRCQAEPRQRIIDGFEKDILKIIQQRKRLSPMSLLTTPKPHSGVGAPQYTTVTSPIRRLLDLIMQLQISDLVNGKGILFSRNDMKRFGSIILSTLEKANQVKYLRQRYWILKYLEPKTGERIPALVIDSGPKRVHIFLEEFLLDADLPLNPAFKVAAGDIVMVKISKANSLSNTLKLEW